MAAKPKGKRRKVKSEERERLQDTMLMVQSARETLAEVDPELVPEMTDIEDCFDTADKALKDVLRN